MELNIFKKMKKKKCDRCKKAPDNEKLYPTSKDEWICDDCKNN